MKGDFESTSRLQKKTVRMLTRSPGYAHTDPIYVSNNFLKLKSILKFEICKFFHRDFNKNKIFNLTPRSLAHSYNTRFNTDISLSHARTNLAANFYFYTRV